MPRLGLSIFNSSRCRSRRTQHGDIISLVSKSHKNITKILNYDIYDGLAIRTKRRLIDDGWLDVCMWCLRYIITISRMWSRSTKRFNGYLQNYCISWQIRANVYSWSVNLNFTLTLAGSILAGWLRCFRELLGLVTDLDFQIAAHEPMNCPVCCIIASM